MTIGIAFVLAIILAALLLFAMDLLRVDVVALGVLLTLVLTGLTTPEEAFSGLSNTAVITVGGVFVISEGLMRTGAVSYISRNMLKVTGNSEVRLIVIVMATAGLLSAFINNVGATAILLPAIIDISRRTEISPSKLCIPLAFGALLGGLCTSIGTPANLLVNSVLSDRGLAPLGIFDFTAVGLVNLTAAIGYMTLIGRHLLPDRPLDERLKNTHSVREKVREDYRLRERLFTARVSPDSPLVGKTIAESQLGKALDLNILDIVRRGRNKPAPSRDEVLLADDLLLIEGKEGKISPVPDQARAGDRQFRGLEIERGIGCEIENLQSGRIRVVEAMLAPHSSLVGKTLREMRFRERFGLTVLAIWREGQPRRTALADLPLRFGDAFLVQGPREKIHLLGKEPDFLLLDPAEQILRTERIKWALGILLLVVTMLVTGLLPVGVTMLLGAILMVLTGCLTIDEAYTAIGWKVIFLMAGMLPLGLALEKTGAAGYLADLIIGTIGAREPRFIPAAILLLVGLLTQILPAPATAVLMAPIALNTALQMRIDARTLLLGVAMASSASFITPIGHKVNVLVMGPGGYKFSDYIRVGLLLNLLVLLMILLWVSAFACT
ncbi:MAG: SLC13 family permease [Chloroflexota bacterium]|nr:SLC13 family permease [Chloroflexota bacterium]